MIFIQVPIKILHKAKGRIMKKIIVTALMLICIIIPFVLRCADNTYIVNIQANSYGIDPDAYVATYDSIANKVIFTPLDPINSDKIIIPMVYVQKLTSDSPGYNHIGAVPNPSINPGHIADFSSSRPYFKIYASRY